MAGFIFVLLTCSIYSISTRISAADQIDYEGSGYDDDEPESYNVTYTSAEPSDMTNVTNTDTHFQCATGESISKTLVCDGQKNCADGSDESLKACKEKNPKFCVLPAHANNITITSCNDILNTSKGDMIDEFSLISLSSKVNGSRDNLQLICMDGKWISPLVDRNQKCESLPTTTSRVKSLNYQNGRKADLHNTHFVRTVVYPQCEDKYYPNAKEATCGENGKWSVDRFDCSSCRKSSDVRTLSLPLLESTSSGKKIICQAHIVSPYLVMTAASCFNQSSDSEYYLNLDGQETSDDSIEPPVLVKIEKIHYSANFAEKHPAHLALAEVKDRFTFGHSLGFVCLDENENTANDVENHENATDPKTPVGRNSVDTQLYSIVVRCSGLDNSPKDSSDEEECVDLDDKNPHIKKGMAMYTVLKNSYRVKGISINTSNKLSDKTHFTDVAQYFDWTKSIINSTNRDHNIADELVNPIAKRYVRDGVIASQHFRIDCSSDGNTSLDFVNGCDLPDKNNYLDYEVECRQDKYQEFCQIAKEAGFGVPEHTILRNIKCQDGFMTYSPQPLSSVCFRGSWLAAIQRCRRQPLVEAFK